MAAGSDRDTKSGSHAERCPCVGATLLQSIALAANETDSIAGALESSLEILCRSGAWDLGHAFLEVPEGRSTMSTGIWFSTDEAHAPFRVATEGMSFAPGTGLIGSVYRSGEARWYPDIGSADFVRREAAAASGLRSALAFPVRIRDRVVAVVELYSGRPRRWDRDWEALAVAVGVTLGGVFEREESRRALQAERDRVEEELCSSRLRIRTLVRRLLEVQEQERRRISHDLHDRLGQALTAIRLDLDELLTRSDTAEPAAVHDERAVLEAARGAVDEAIDQVRTLSFDLRPAMLDELGLAAAVRSYASRRARAARIELELDVAELSHSLAEDAESACFRILQESITNVLRHARARRLTVTLRDDGDDVLLVVSDDGDGFQPPTAAVTAAVPHLGLDIMRERAEHACGRIEIHTEPGQGTNVRLRVPAAATTTSRR